MEVARTTLGVGDSSAWLFTRGDESVRFVVRPDGKGLELIISGPASQRATYAFNDAELLRDFAEQHAGRLIAAGYARHATADRRVIRRSAESRPKANPFERETTARHV